MRTLGGQTFHRFLVTPGDFPEHLSAELCNVWIVFLKHRAGMDVIMERIIEPIIIEPILHRLSPVFTWISSGIGAFPESLVGRA